jgi:translation initiation factor IF-2
VSGRTIEIVTGSLLQGLNVELYWRNRDPRRFVNIVPTSAITGEGICDLMWLLVKLTQSMMMDRLMFVEELQCTVLEVKVVEGYGHTIDAVLVNGRIREGDKVCIPSDYVVFYVAHACSHSRHLHPLHVRCLRAVFRCATWLLDM